MDILIIIACALSVSCWAVLALVVGPALDRHKKGIEMNTEQIRQLWDKIDPVSVGHTKD